MSTFAIHAKIVTTGTGARIPDAMSLIERLEVSVGGQVISGASSYYGTAVAIKRALTGQRGDTETQHGLVADAKAYQAIHTVGGTGAGVEECELTFSGWQYGLLACKPEYVDSSDLGPIVVRVTFAPASVIATASGAGSYTVSGISSTIEVATISNPSYDSMKSAIMANKGYLPICFKEPYVVRANHSGITRASVSARSLDRVMCAFRNKDFDTNSPLIATESALGHKQESHYAPCEIFGPKKKGTSYTDLLYPHTAEFWFSLGGTRYPQYRATFGKEWQNLARDNRYVEEFKDLPAPLVGGQQATTKQVQCAKLNLAGSESPCIASGINSKQQSLIVEATTGAGFADVNSVICFIMCETSALLMVGSQREIFTDNGASEDYAPNGQIIFTLPSNTLVDLDSLRIEFNAECPDVAGTGVSRLPQDIHKLIRRVQVTAGGQDLGFAYDGWSHLKHGVDGITGREPHPTSHPRILRTGLDPTKPDGRTAAQEAKEAAIAAAQATLPTLYEGTTEHIPLKAQLDGGVNGVTPADGSINIIGRHSAMKLSVCGYSADGYTNVMTESKFTWNQIAAAIQPDGAQLVPLFEMLGFVNYSTSQAVVDEIAAARAAIQEAQAIPTLVSENAAAIGGVRFCWDQLGGFLETVQPRILDLAILPTITITIHLNSPEVIPRAMKDDLPGNFLLPVTDAGGIAGTFKVSNPRLHINAIGFTTSAYDSYVSAALSKRAIELPFKSYHHYADSNFLDSISFQTSSRSVDKIHFQLSRPSDRTIAADAQQIEKVDGYHLMTKSGTDNLFYSSTNMVDDRMSGEKYLAVHYATSHTGQGFGPLPSNPAATFYLNINGTLQPSFPADATWWFRETTGAMSEQREPWNGAGVLLPEYINHRNHKTLRLNRPGSTVQTASGFNTQNSMLYATLMCPSGLANKDGAVAPARIDVWTEHTSIIRVVGPRDIEVVV